MIDIEQPVVRRILDGLPVGTALDAACGTGRHTAYLHELGHRVIGIDASPEIDRQGTRSTETSGTIRAHRTRSMQLSVSPPSQLLWSPQAALLVPDQILRDRTVSP
jgi:2-polyprenyl-3-methyl-5-hydroxy-6-metoxy-1,4-benzoquinol methylase